MQQRRAANPCEGVSGFSILRNISLYLYEMFYFFYNFCGILTAIVKQITHFHGSLPTEAGCAHYIGFRSVTEETGYLR